MSEHEKWLRDISQYPHQSGFTTSVCERLRAAADHIAALEQRLAEADEALLSSRTNRSVLMEQIRNLEQKLVEHESTGRFVVLTPEQAQQMNAASFARGAAKQRSADALVSRRKTGIEWVAALATDEPEGGG